jgi:hypothetical protein
VRRDRLEPLRSRHSAQINVGATAHVDIALSRSVASSMSSDARKPSVAPNCEIAVRSASSGTKVSPARAIAGARRRRRRGSTRRGADVGRERLALGERSGQRPLNSRVPDVFERARTCARSTALYWR